MSDDPQDYEVIAQAVTSLEYHDEENMAEQLADVQSERMRQAESRAHTLKQATFYLTLTSVLGIGVVGAALGAYRTDFVAAAGFSVYLFVMLALIGLLHTFLDTAAEWFREEVSHD